MMKSISIAALMLCATPALATYNGNPYIPDPVAVVNPADIIVKGDARYCVKGKLIPGWTCDQELSANGGTGTVAAVAPAGSIRSTPPSCEHGDKNK